MTAEQGFHVLGITLDLSGAQSLAEAQQLLDVLKAAAKDAFRRLSLERHPDHGGTDAQMVELIDAKEAALAAGVQERTPATIHKIFNPGRPGPDWLRQYMDDMNRMDEMMRTREAERHNERLRRREQRRRDEQDEKETHTHRPFEHFEEQKRREEEEARLLEEMLARRRAHAEGKPYGEATDHRRAKSTFSFDPRNFQVNFDFDQEPPPKRPQPHRKPTWEDPYRPGDKVERDS